MSSQELNQALWNAANVMRSTMSADEYKNYLLGLVFYKYLSDRQLYAAADLLEDRQPESLDEAQKIYEDAIGSEDWEDLQDELTEKYGFAIEPKYTFTALYNEINEKTFATDHLRQAMRDVEQGGEAIRGQKPYEDLFEDFDIDSKSLGTTPAKRNAMLADVMKELAHIDFNRYGTDALGDAYEYLIGEFAAGSGKKAGEFYTPQAVSELITRIVTAGKEGKPGFSIYDPCMGSGSLLLHARNFMQEDCRNNIQYFGQELSHTTYNLARMNMILHNVPFTYQHFRNGDLCIGIADFNAYNLILNAAPEIANSWSIALVPGVEDEETGEIYRYMSGGAESTIMFASDDEREEKAWAFMDWWSSASVQAEFGQMLQIMYGDEYIWPTANAEAFTNLPYPTSDKQIIMEQASYILEAPRLLGSYMMERELSNAFNDVVVNGETLRSRIDEAVKIVKRETDRKLEEFGYIDSEGRVIKEYEIPDVDRVRSILER